MAENFEDLVSKDKRFCFPWKVEDLTLFEALTGGALDCLNRQHSVEFNKKLIKKRQLPRGFPGGMGGFGIDRYIIQSGRSPKMYIFYVMINNSSKCHCYTLHFHQRVLDFLDCI